MRNTIKELPGLKYSLLHKNPKLPRQGFLGFQLGFNFTLMIIGKFLNLVLERGGEDQLDRWCEKRKVIQKAKEERNVLKQ
jgi:hypothetical protein